MNCMSIYTNKKLLFLFLLLAPLYLLAQGKNIFPLKLSDNKKYLLDKNNQPFLIKEFSAWGLIQSLSEKDESDFLDSIKKQGFNAVITCILNKHAQMVGDPPNWQGVAPLLRQWDFSKPNPVYFEHVDRFFKIAEQKGFFVMALPFYMGYRDDGSQGWWDELKNPNNDTLKMRKYGEYIGTRYKNTSNMMWVAGGDNNCAGELFAYENNMILGLKSMDKTHLWSGHFDTNLSVSFSTENIPFAQYMDIDGLYVWTETILMDKGPQYKTELDHYNKGKMIIQLDQSYEHDVPHYADNENYQWIRRKMYDGLLSGCAGTSFSSGTRDNQCYTFANWRPLMNTEGMQQAARCFRLFESRPWEKLVPDQDNDIIISGRGKFGELDYICAAKTTDNSTYIMYIPNGRVFYLNMQKMSSKPMRMTWYNPRTDEVINIGVAELRAKFGVAPPSTDDWVLVFDDNSLKLPPPGKIMH
jgi:Protein of unknown function (DUF4038)/Putative collagen-binding domain of a collagenase